MKSRWIFSLAFLSVCMAVHVAAGPAQPVPYRVPDRWPDAAWSAEPDAVQLEGWLGGRVGANETNRLLKVDLEPLLAGFRKKPGVHPWIGEHIGKWMHAATLAWVHTGNEALRAKLDYAAAGLVKAQEPDGYLGTYVPGKRFGLFPDADWDVWSHKYNLIGLLTYYHYTGNEAALQACRRMGDLLIANFGPGQRSILTAGTHVGMAATSVLEPIVLLYRTTGDARYLAFARHIVSAWDEPGGPKIIATLLKEKSVAKTANGKAYEMLSNLVGLCELARATGEKEWLAPVIIAWEDIVARRLYLTGSASYGEHFHADYDLPNQPGANIGETCVTTTWIQLNSQLLRLTGQARFGEQLEKTFYNHLAAAQRPDGAQWCYYTPLEGTKPYGPGISCCVSSGPRGMELAPPNAYLTIPARDGEPEGLVVNLYETSRFSTRINGRTVVLEQKTDFPKSGVAGLRIDAAQPVVFSLRLRVPEWSRTMTVSGKGIRQSALQRQNGWILIPARTWKSGDSVKITLAPEARLVPGGHTNAGRVALMWGPFVLAYDAAMNPGLPAPGVLTLVDRKPAFTPAFGGDGKLVFASEVTYPRQSQPRRVVFVPFANAGETGSRFMVWMRAPGTEFRNGGSLFSMANETRSREGNLNGQIADDDFGTAVVTFDGHSAKEDWFAVETDRPVRVGRVVFGHGKVFHDGGWFDAGTGKPKVQGKRTPGAAWEDLGVLEKYPQTTAADSKGLKDGQAFALVLDTPATVVALRVKGKPACGDNPGQAFTSCAELQAYEK